MNGLALGVDEGVGGLGREEPLECGGGRGGGVRDEEGGVVGESEGEEGAFDGVRVREREGDRGLGFGVDDGVNGEGAGVQIEGAAVGGLETEECRGVDGG